MTSEPDTLDQLLPPDELGHPPVVELLLADAAPTSTDPPTSAPPPPQPAPSA